MTNTKFRKRMLLSSVAMLLVALVALGSATFAWFSVREDAVAKGLKAVTTAESSLTIKELWTDDWANDIAFDANNYNPTSIHPVTFDGTTWQKASSAGLNEGAMAADGTLTTISSLGATDAAYSTVYAKYGETTDTTSDKDLYVSVSLPSGTGHADADKFIRVALIPVAGSASDNDSAAAALGSSAIIIGGALDDDFAATPASWKKDAQGNNPTPSASTSAATNTFGTSIKLGNVTNGTAYKYRVVAYYEGTDPDCIENNAGQTLNDFVFSFTVQDHA